MRDFVIENVSKIGLINPKLLRVVLLYKSFNEIFNNIVD